MAEFPIKHMIEQLGETTRAQNSVNYIKTEDGSHVVQKGNAAGATYTLDTEVLSKLIAIETTLATLSNINTTLAKLNTVDTKLDRLTQIENKLNSIEGKLTTIEGYLSNIQSVKPTDHVGYSTDTKPQNGKKGDTFLELDTKTISFHDGNGWVSL